MPKPSPVRLVLRKTLEYVIAGLGAFVAVLTLFPRMTITVAGPSDDESPLSASFTVSNDGYLPAKNVVATCTVAHINVGQLKIIGEEGQQTSLGEPEWKVDKLSAGEKMGIPISDCFIVANESLHDASIGLRVTYYHVLPFWQHRSTSVFTVRSMGNGRFYWYSSPN